VEAISNEDVAAMQHAVVVAKQHVARLHRYADDVFSQASFTLLRISPGMMFRSPKNTSVMPTSGTLQRRRSRRKRAWLCMLQNQTGRPVSGWRFTGLCACSMA